MNFEAIKPFLKYIGLLLTMAGAALFYRFFPSVKQDNAIEETIEDYIEKETGLHIDLSPDSKEPDGKSK